MKKHRLFAAVLIVLSTAFGLVALEVGSTVILNVKFHRDLAGRNHAVRTVLDELPQQQQTGGGDQSRKLNLGREPHPYFGFTTTRHFPGVNNLGFFSHVNYPYEREADEFVVGVFGGSVASQLASDGTAMDEWKKLLLPLAEAKGRTHVTVLNLALPGWRQPQQFHALHYFLSTIDLAVTLDGVNEVVGIHTNLDRNYPIAYPNPEVWLPLTQGMLRTEDMRNGARIMDLQDRVRATTAALTKGVLAYSGAAHLGWTLLVNHDLNQIDRLRKSMATSEWQDYDTTPNGDEETERVKDSYFDLYAQSIMTASLEAKRKDKHSVHFIQPNQYLEGTKPLSAEEKDLYLANKYYGMAVTRYYPRLAAMTAQLRTEGAAAYDLSGAFAGHAETLYRDDCCHLNAKGNLVLAKAMAPFLLSAGGAVSH